jgi:Cu+-exporting ATPase
MIERTFAISGMTCASCQTHVHRALASVPGVKDAQVNLLSHTARVMAEPDVLPEDLIAAVQRTGYSASSLSGEAGAQTAIAAAQTHERNLGARALAALIAGSLAMALAMAHMGSTEAPSLLWLQCAMAAAVMLFAAPEIYTAAWRAARHGASNMNTLVALGTLAGFVASLPGTIAPSWAKAHGIPADLYYEAVVLILAFLLAGRWLEARARKRATASLAQFASLEPKDVRFLAAADETVADLDTAAETVLPLDALQTGDVLRVLAGERIPTDGIILRGRAAIDESMLTGEPLPVTRETGGRVAAGTLNLDGVLVLRATAVGRDSTVAQLRRLLDQAQTGRAAMERIADRVSAVFVPVVLLLAVAVLLGWSFAATRGLWHATYTFALTQAIAVLVVACPCAMGLAVPAAITVAVGRGAQLGLLIKGGEALERLAVIDTIALDKTGTLTRGIPVVHGATPSPQESLPEGDIIALAAAVERASTHPLAAAILRYAQDRAIAFEQIAVLEVEVLAGIGVRGVAAGRSVAVGSAHVLEAGAQPAESDLTAVYIVIDGVWQATLTLEDSLRAESREAVAALRRRGITPVLVTGDTEAAARGVAALAGISDVRARCTPAQKVEIVRDLQQQGRRVAMAGDGINDAAALAQSDAGLAMAAGTDLAREAGDVLLLHADLRLVPLAIDLGRRARRIMRQNLGWALAYNVIALPVAAGIFYPRFHLLLTPAIAAAAMALSSVSVLANSLRLRRFGPTR